MSNLAGIFPAVFDITGAHDALVDVRVLHQTVAVAAVVFGYDGDDHFSQRLAVFAVCIRRHIESLKCERFRRVTREKQLALRRVTPAGDVRIQTGQIVDWRQRSIQRQANGLHQF